MLQEERAAGNPVAGLIRKLSLEANRITLELPNWLAADDEEGEEAEEEPDEDGRDADEDEAAPSTSPTVRTARYLVFCCTLTIQLFTLWCLLRCWLHIPSRGQCTAGALLRQSSGLHGSRVHESPRHACMHASELHVRI